jgi:hypothetical protein
MKKKAVLLLLILLITSFLYSVIAYYMIISYEKEQNWVAKVKDTTHPDFKVIKLNASLYTFVDDTEFENVNENIILNNKIYHVFKKRIKDNMLHLYCLSNSNQNDLDVVLKKFTDTQLLTDVPSDKSPIEKLLQSFYKDYLAITYDHFEYALTTMSKSETLFENQNKKLLSGFENSNDPPPELV